MPCDSRFLNFFPSQIESISNYINPNFFNKTPNRSMGYNPCENINCNNDICFFIKNYIKKTDNYIVWFGKNHATHAYNIKELTNCKSNTLGIAAQLNIPYYEWNIQLTTYTNQQKIKII